MLDLQTDLVPGVEFVVARAVLMAPDRSEDAPVSVGDEFVEGARIAVFEDVPAGGRLFRVDLLDGGGAVVATGRTQVELREGRAVRVRIFRSCLGITCADDETCTSGACVPAECNDDSSSEFCEEAECDDASDCPGGDASCAVPVCSAGACLLDGDDDLCSATQVCNPDDGCTDAAPSDAGPPEVDAGDELRDSGVDAGALDAGFDAGAPSTPFDCAMPVDGATIAVYTMLDADRGQLPDERRIHNGTFPRVPPGVIAGPPGCEQAMIVESTMTYGVVPDSADFARRDGSIEVRMFLTTDLVGGIVSRDATGIGEGHFSLLMDEGGALVARFETGGRYVAACSDARVPPGRWFYVGVNFSAAGPELWINGVRQRGMGMWRIEGEMGACGGTTAVSLQGESNPWLFGTGSWRTLNGMSEPANPATVGLVLDHVRISAMPRDFSRFVPP